MNPLHNHQLMAHMMDHMKDHNMAFLKVFMRQKTINMYAIIVFSKSFFQLSTLNVSIMNPYKLK